MSIHKLNLLMSYPVQWSEYKVINNFVQNFYDAMDPAQFSERFRPAYEDHIITMRSDIGFSKEWLFYLGVSSKRQSDRHYAGHFGEGFKVAALVAYRDMGLQICMESRDWRLRVTEADTELDGQKVKVLAYELDNRPYEETSVLRLLGAAQSHFDCLCRIISDFYYEENTLFDDCIAKNDSFAIYRAKKTSSGRALGGLFINLQRREWLPVPIFFCVHRYELPGDDRERGGLKPNIIRAAICKTICFLTSFQALEVLEEMASLWHDSYSRKVYRLSWGSILTELIKIICLNPNAYNRFRELYGNKLLADSCWDRAAHEKAIAYAWLRNSEYQNLRVVETRFILLGIESIYSLCSRCGGFETEVSPSAEEAGQIHILESAARRFFSDLLCYEQLPECRILLNTESPLLGKARSVREDRRVYSTLGMRVTRKIRTVYIKRSLLLESSFSSALPIYLHELLHQYGGDCSRQFRKALLEMNRIIIENRMELLSYEYDWRQTYGYPPGNCS